MSLMTMSISGAVLILVILAVRAGLKDRLPKRTFAVLWTVALFRLLIPFSVPFSWSAYTLLQNMAPAAVMNPVQDLQSSPGAGTTAEMNPFQEAGPVSGEETVELVNPPQEARQISGKGSESDSTLFDILKGIWTAGFLFCTIAFAWIYFRCCREFRMSLPVEDCFLENWQRTHPLLRRLSIRQSDQILSPLSYGVWHPVILLPKSAKYGDRFQMRYVLEHEYVHIRYFDAAVKLLLTAALCMHWFNPCVYLMYIFFNRDLELACDEAVVHRFGEEERSAYAMALIEMEEEKSGLIPLGNSFSKNAIEERIGAIMRIKKNSPLVHGLSAALVCGVTLLFATSCGSHGEAEKAAVSESSAGTASNLVSDDISERSAAYAISIGEEFEEYEKFGLSYDKKSDFLMYKNETVGYFKDETKPNVYIRLAEGSGKLGITVNRDQSGKITDFSVFPFDENGLPDSSVSEDAAVKEGSGIIRWDDSGDIVSIVSFPSEERDNLEAYAVEQRAEEAGAAEGTNVSYESDLKAGAAQETDASYESDLKAGAAQETDVSYESDLKAGAAQETDASYESDLKAGAVSDESAYSKGNSDAEKSSIPEEYEKLGVKASNGKNNEWTYKEKGVAVIYDKGHWIYANDTIPEKKAVYLEVVRDKKDRVTDLKEITKKEMQKLFDEE